MVREGICVGEIHRIWYEAAMGVSGQRRGIYLSHDPKTDYDNAIRKKNNKHTPYARFRM